MLIIKKSIIQINIKQYKKIQIFNKLKFVISYF